MRYYSGYMTKGKQRFNFETRAASKKNAMKNLQEQHPGWRIVVKVSYKKAVAG